MDISNNPQANKTESETFNPDNSQAVNLSQDPNLINAELLRVDPQKEPERYQNLLGKLTTSINSPVRSEAEIPKSTTDISSGTQVEIQPSRNTLNALESLVQKIDPKYVGDIGILRTNLQENNLPDRILQGLIPDLSKLIESSIAALSQAQTETESEINITSRTNLAANLIKRSGALPVKSPRIQSGIFELRKIYHLEDSQQDQLVQPETTRENRITNETAEAELIFLAKNIKELQERQSSTQNEIQEIAKTNQDLTKQKITKNQESEPKIAEFQTGFEKLSTFKKAA